MSECKKVWVCMCETPEEGKVSVSVYESLDDALERMRVEFAGYKKTHPKAYVKWFMSKDGDYREWFDACEAYGYSVKGVEFITKGETK